MLKALITRFVRLLLSPWRWSKRRRYADPEAKTLQHRELPNEQYLPVVARYIAAGESAVISVKGFSMRPFLEQCRDKVKLSPWTELHVGDAILAEISQGHFVLHRIIAIDGHHLTLMGDGNVRGVEHCTLADVRGLVTQYIRPGGHVIMASDPQLCRKIRCWRRLLPIRRLLLFIYKATI